MAEQPYTLHHGHDPDLDLDVLVRTYADGATTVSFRPGKDDTTAAWGPEMAVRSLLDGAVA